jgi:uridine monophosphate synthetase
MSDHSALIFSLYEIGCIQFGEFTLKSGQTSTIYINFRKIISYPIILSEVAKAIWEKIQDKKFDLICGVPYTALPIATCVSLMHQIPMIMRRKEKKDYGTKQIIEGEFQPGQSCLVIEDVITTGASLMETILDLEQAGLFIHDVIALLDREQGGKEYLENKYHVTTILNLSNVLRILLDSTIITSSDREFIEQLIS